MSASAPNTLNFVQRTLLSELRAAQASHDLRIDASYVKQALTTVLAIHGNKKRKSVESFLKSCNATAVDGYYDASLLVLAVRSTGVKFEDAEWEQVVGEFKQPPDQPVLQPPSPIISEATEEVHLMAIIFHRPSLRTELFG